MEPIQEIELQLKIWLDRLANCDEDAVIIIDSLREVEDMVQGYIAELDN